jgi:hypothetical protein
MHISTAAAAGAKSSSSMLWRGLLLLLQLSFFLIQPALGNIQVPQIDIFPIPEHDNLVVGGEVILQARLTNQQILGYGPFLQLDLPSQCYELVQAYSSYETYIPMPQPTKTNFTSNTCLLDPVISTSLPLGGSCTRARQICGSVSHLHGCSIYPYLLRA